MEVASLIEHDLHLFADRFGAKQVVECLAAGHAVAFIVGATVGAGHQMLHRGIGLWQQPATEETQTPLGKEQTIELDGHGDVGVWSDG